MDGLDQTRGDLDHPQAPDWGMSRRSLLVGALLGVAASALRAGQARGAAGALFVGCRTDAAGQDHLTAFDAAGAPRFELPLPARGHGIAFHPHQPQGVLFARRPGRFAVVFDYAEGVALRRFDAAEGRHFYGHGTFSPDGRWLFSTENAYASGDGVLGVRDAADGYRLVDELPGGGIGPHDVGLLPDRTTLVTAVGGIRTHPAYDRAKLNLDTMEPAVASIEAASGRVLDRVTLAPHLHQASIRHLDVAADGRVAIGMQYEGGKQDRVPLVGLWQDGAVRLFEAPEPVRRRMRQYVGSVRFDASGRLVAASCPRGGLVTIWDADTGTLVRTLALPDGCGVAPAREGGCFLLTGLGGRIVRADVTDGAPGALLGQVDGAWDNHLGGPA